MSSSHLWRSLQLSYRVIACSCIAKAITSHNTVQFGETYVEKRECKMRKINCKDPGIFSDVIPNFQMGHQKKMTLRQGGHM